MAPKIFELKKLSHPFWGEALARLEEMEPRLLEELLVQPEELVKLLEHKVTWANETFLRLIDGGMDLDDVRDTSGKHQTGSLARHSAITGSAIAHTTRSCTRLRNTQPKPAIGPASCTGSHIHTTIRFTQ